MTIKIISVNFLQPNDSALDLSLTKNEPNNTVVPQPICVNKTTLDSPSNGTNACLRLTAKRGASDVTLDLTPAPCDTVDCTRCLVTQPRLRVLYLEGATGAQSGGGLSRITPGGRHTHYRVSTKACVQTLHIFRKIQNLFNYTVNIEKYINKIYNIIARNLDPV